MTQLHPSVSTSATTPTAGTAVAAPARRPGALSAAVRAGLAATARVSPGLAGRVAMELWRRPGRPGPVRPHERAVHDAARRGRLDGPREVVTYAWGDGRRPVLLVHGWGSRASRFADLVPALLAEGLSPVAYDAWGHGDTRGPVGTILDHQQVIDELARRHGGLEAVVAHSLGVPFALHAVREGVVVDRVVTIGGPGDFGYLVDAFCGALGVGDPVPAALRRAIERRWFGGDAGIWQRFSVGPAPDARLLVVHDVDDDVVVRQQADVLLDAYGDRATLHETSGLGHSRILRDPAVIAVAAAFAAGRNLDR